MRGMEFGKGEGMLLILIRTVSGTFLWGVYGCSLFISMQYRKFGERVIY
jgi:hypothetical protein